MISCTLINKTHYVSQHSIVVEDPKENLKEEGSKENITDAPVQEEVPPKAEDEVAAISETDDQLSAHDEDSDDDFVVVGTEEDM